MARKTCSTRTAKTRDVIIASAAIFTYDVSTIIDIYKTEFKAIIKEKASSYIIFYSVFHAKAFLLTA